MLKEQIRTEIARIINASCIDPPTREEPDRPINCHADCGLCKADQILALFPQGEEDGEEERVWYCTEKGNCEWQGFALNSGLAWGEKKNVSDAWLKYHSEYCKGRLVQGVIVDNQSKQAALKEQMERVIERLELAIKTLRAQHTYGGNQFSTEYNSGLDEGCKVIGELQQSLKAELEGK